MAQAWDWDGRDAYARGAAGGLLLSNGRLAGRGLKRQQQGEESKENEGINGAGEDCRPPVTVQDRSEKEVEFRKMRSPSKGGPGERAMGLAARHLGALTLH